MKIISLLAVIIFSTSFFDTCAEGSDSPDYKLYVSNQTQDTIYFEVSDQVNYSTGAYFYNKNDPRMWLTRVLPGQSGYYAFNWYLKDNKKEVAIYKESTFRRYEYNPEYISEHHLEDSLLYFSYQELKDLDFKIAYTEKEE